MTALFYVSFFLVCKTLFICLFINPTLSDPRATEAALICTNQTAPFSQLPIFIANFVAAMEIVTPLVATQRFADVSNGTGNLTVYAYGECMKDLSRNDCNVCLAQCKAQILRCLPYQRGILGGQLFFDGCYLRYDDYYFSEEAISSEDKTVCGNTSFSGNQSVFKANTVELVRNLSVQAPENDGFYVGSVNRGNVSVYGLAQCWELVNGSSCKECLAKSVRMIGNCPPKDEGRVLNAGCYLRYSTQKFFYNSTVQRLPGGNAGRRLVIILAATSSALALIMIAATAAFFFNKKVLKKKRERRQLGGLLDTVNKSKLNFSYDTLEVATKYFHQSNKLGQGGCGSVYKGVLPDGRAVAVKRLFFNSKQWVDHFFNEVNLISGIHHHNLVKLLGCSIAGPESLLVYEYVPNRSLNDHFFGKNKSQQLSWDVRFKIVLGTARGLTYLHEESNLRIIHRDIKLSNVLLDQDYTAKIADFGLARLFPEDNTHISTGIAGTLGYMAPEYAICGKLTTKADVYSFGVLVIEILCGKKSISFSQNSFSILHTVWQLYGSGRLCEAIDPALDKCFDEEEACRLLQIGLLCVQASAELRPSMSSVVEMLTNNQNIPQPTQPPFLNNNSAQFSQSVSPQIYDSSPDFYHQCSENTMTKSLMQPR